MSKYSIFPYTNPQKGDFIVKFALYRKSHMLFWRT